MARKAMILAFLVAALGPSVVAAQRGGPGRQDVDRAQLEQRVRAQMGRLMRERLGLDEVEAQPLVAGKV